MLINILINMLINILIDILINILINFDQFWKGEWKTWCFSLFGGVGMLEFFSFPFDRPAAFFCNFDAQLLQNLRDIAAFSVIY